MNAISFFTGHPAPDGTTLAEILSSTDDTLEGRHDIIQWCFPLHEPSAVNADAPIVTPREQTLLATPAIQKTMRDVLARWLSFYGFHSSDNAVIPSSDFPTQSRRWNTPLNHNHLRVTRIIRSLRLFGLDAESQQVHDAFAAFAGSPESKVSPTSRAYWTAALRGPLFGPVRP